jgi:type I site-specific restriction endonuclease
MADKRRRHDAPEQKARQSIDVLLAQAGWHVCDMNDANIHAERGVAIREFPLNTGYGFADYLLYIDGKAAGVIEAKKEGSTLTGVEVQSARYAQGLPATLRTVLWGQLNDRHKVSCNLLRDDDVRTVAGVGRQFLVEHVPRARQCPRW